MTDKKGIVEFNWIFVLIIGAVILFLAVFFVGKLIGTQRYASETELVNSFDILLNPFASIGGMGTVTLAKTIQMAQTTQINQTCSTKDRRITMYLRSESSTGKKWGEWSLAKQIYNKYIFSNSFMQAKTFEVFSMPLNLPFRIDDLIFILDKDYCFVDAPAEVKSEIGMVNMSKLQFVNSQNDCKAGSTEVCFETSGCDIRVVGDCTTTDCNKFDYGYISKKGKLDYATTPMMYAAIFSDQKMYDCEMEMIKERLGNLIDIYRQKAIILANEGCKTDEIQTSLEKLKSETSMENLFVLSREVSRTNPLECPVF
jgi:hypothetical protein